jgi:hypothetical protein
MITVPVPPQHAWRVAMALDNERIDYHYDKIHGTITTYAAAQVVIDDALGQQGGGMVAGWDPFRRLPQNRSRSTDALGFVFSLAIVGGVIVLSGRLAELAASVGANGDLVRGVGILLAGAVVVRLLVQFGLRRDPRRHMFVQGMMGLFLAAALWYICVGVGLPMMAAVERLVP